MSSDIILLGHGSGGTLSHQLLNELIIPTLSGVNLCDQNDSAILAQPDGRLAFTTDSYVVDPIFFPGGDIGALAINGTVNDLAMAGARPMVISVGFILEEGLPFADLHRILASMNLAAREAGLAIVTGDTKVVPRGKADKLYINTSGLGVLEHDFNIAGNRAALGDKVLINGTLGDHGIAVMSCREGLNLTSPVQSDCAPLNGLVSALLNSCGQHVHVLRDPTRGGAATTLKEIAIQSAVEITLYESALPISPEVAGVCALLGLDPLYVANEGKFLVIVHADAAEQALRVMRKHPLGRNAAIIGDISGTAAGKVRLQTTFGGLRAIEMMAGEQLPRIC